VRGLHAPLGKPRHKRPRPVQSAAPGNGFHLPIGFREKAITVSDNLTTDIPITNRELDVIETYLNTLLDDMLRKP
jgi:hypothetical protein